MSTISASTTTTTAYKVTADTTGTLVLQTGATPTTALTIDGSQNVTFAKGFTVGATAAPAFSAYQSSAQTLSSATWTKLQFQTEEFDTASAFDNATNYRFTPQIAGYYQVNGGLAIAASNTGIRVGVYKNGTVFKYLSFDSSTAAGAAYGSALVYLNGSSDYIELYGRVATGQALDALLYATYFQAAMIRSAT
jgi:hypothetical protein